MKTLRAIIHSEIAVYDTLFRMYSSCLRYAYNRILDNNGKIEFKSLYKDLASKFNLNKRYLYDIIEKVSGLYSFHGTTRKKKGSDICFGTAENFRSYNDGEISKPEFIARRNWMVFSSGEAYRHGNSNHFITKDETGQYWIESTLIHNGQGKKPRADRTEKLKLFIPAQYHEEFDRQTKWTLTILNTWITKGYYEARIMFGEDVEYLNHPNIVSLDFNHNTLDYSVIVAGVRVKTGCFTLNLGGKRSSKQQSLIEVIKHKLIPLAFRYKAHFVIEGLSHFKTDRKSIGTRKARKKIGSMPRQMYLNLMISIPKKVGIKTELVEPRYTSHIAKMKYSNEFKNKDQGASYTIGRKRLLGKKNWKSETYDFYERLPKKARLQALCIAILLNVKRLLRGDVSKVKPRFTNFSLWWYLYHINFSKLKGSLQDVKFSIEYSHSFYRH